MIIKLLIIFVLTTSSLMAVPQAVVFDFGGVMTGKSNRDKVVHFLCNTFNLSEKEFKKAHTLKREAIKNGMTDAEFWTDFAEKKGIFLPKNFSSQLKKVMKEAININPKMFSLVDELKQKKITVGMLSNIDKRLANFVSEFGFYKPFSPCLLSCDIGVEKPNLKAYKILLQTLNLDPEKVVFIDDKIENVTAAKKLGIDAFLFQSTKQTRKELEDRGLLK
jgi:epoxide hydrolase-like predicted phosphatase